MGLKMSSSEERSFKVLPLICVLILISKPAAEVLNHLPGNRDSQNARAELLGKGCLFFHLPEDNATMWRREQQLFGKHRAQKSSVLGRLLLPCCILQDFPLLIKQCSLDRTEQQPSSCTIIPIGQILLGKGNFLSVSPPGLLATKGLLLSIMETKYAVNHPLSPKQN